MLDSALDSLIRTVREAAAQRTPLRIHGGGTKAFLTRTATATPLDLRPLAGIVSHEPTELVVTALAGTPLAELEAALAAHAQVLPFEPPRFGTGGTVGGMVAAGLSGPARASAGAVRDYVLGVQMLNGRGELLRYGGQVMKNVAGYDVSRLMAGSWGTLGVLVEVSLKVLPRAPAEATLRFELGQAEALEQLHRWGAQPLPLNASLWREEAGRGVLYLRLRGAVAAVESAGRSLGGERLAEDAAQALWVALRDQADPFFTDRPAGLALWRLSLPQTAPVLPPVPGQHGAAWVEWQGAQRWVLAPPAAAPALAAQAREVGGSATLFGAEPDHSALGYGPLDVQDPVLGTLNRRLRAEFDPHGILNPGLVHTA